MNTPLVHMYVGRYVRTYQSSYIYVCAIKKNMNVLKQVRMYVRIYKCTY